MKALRQQVIATALVYFNTGNGDANDGSAESIWNWRDCVAIACREIRDCDERLAMAAGPLADCLREVADFWAGGDAPPALEAKMRRLLRFVNR